jgi:hypothetical protein
MGKWDRFRDQLLGGEADHNIGFTRLISYLKRLGMDERVEGDHHIFTHLQMVEIINLQPGKSGKAKPYQVRQVRSVIEGYGLGEGVDVPHDGDEEER